MAKKTRVAKLTGLIGFPISINNFQGHGENDVVEDVFVAVIPSLNVALAKKSSRVNQSSMRVQS